MKHYAVMLTNGDKYDERIFLEGVYSEDEDYMLAAARTVRYNIIADIESYGECLYNYKSWIEVMDGSVHIDQIWWDKIEPYLNILEQADELRAFDPQI